MVLPEERYDVVRIRAIIARSRFSNLPSTAGLSGDHRLHNKGSAVTLHHFDDWPTDYSIVTAFRLRQVVDKDKPSPPRRFSDLRTANGGTDETDVDQKPELDSDVLAARKSCLPIADLYSRRKISAGKPNLG